MKYMVSADFGQATDYTAVAVTKRRLVPTSGKYNATDWRMEGDIYNPERVEYREARQDVEQHYDLIRLDRVQLRTSYTQIAKGIVKLVQELNAVQRKEDALRPRQPVDVGLAIDEGGVGKAVKDILVDTLKDLKDGIP